MIAKTDHQTAQHLRDRILSSDGERIRRIILYGSRAQGTGTAGSDFDLLVIESDPVSSRDEIQRLRRLLSGLHVPVDVWVMGLQEFEETKDVIGGLACPAHKYGVVLYENG